MMKKQMTNISDDLWLRWQTVVAEFVSVFLFGIYVVDFWQEMEVYGGMNVNPRVQGSLTGLDSYTD